MEENQETQDTVVTGLVVSEPIRSHLYEASKWARFLAIVGFVFSVIIVLGGFMLIIHQTSIPMLKSLMGNNSAFESVIGFIYIIIGIIYFIISYSLFNFSVKTKNGILYLNQIDLEAGLDKLKSFFKIIGVMTLIFIALYFVAIISVLGAATH